MAGKGPSAAFRMARASNLLQEFAGELLHPGAVLQRVNDILCQDHQPAAFVTCFYIVLDPASGKIEFANAGHNLPYKRSSGQQNQVDELYATGMPLGIFPKRIYEQQTAWISPGEALLLLSDGVLEARDRQGRIFGEERVLSMLKEYSADRPFVAFAKDKILEFTESEWDRQDDITLIKMFRLKQIQLQIVAENINIDEAGYSRLAEFSLSSAVGNERLAMERLAEIVRPLGLDAPRLENLKTAVAETVMNAIHHGNRDQTEIPVSIDVRLRGQKLFVRVIDSGSDPFPEIPVPDLEAKLSGEQSARGWGLFLIQQMVDEMFVSIEDDHHTVELVMYLDGDIDDDNE
ncbi:MAG: SpoIIE family protein phosphatase [Anaerolineales bacterium]|nr:SpoIIE family protein phosphatase [Anaerolineales bacterium]